MLLISALKKNIKTSWSPGNQTLKWGFQPIHHKDAILKTPCGKDKVTRRIKALPLAAHWRRWSRHDVMMISGGRYHLWRRTFLKVYRGQIYNPLGSIKNCVWSLTRSNPGMTSISASEVCKNTEKWRLRRRRPWTEWPSNKSLPV